MSVAVNVTSLSILSDLNILPKRICFSIGASYPKTSPAIFQSEIRIVPVSPAVATLIESAEIVSEFAFPLLLAYKSIAKSACPSPKAPLLIVRLFIELFVRTLFAILIKPDVSIFIWFPSEYFIKPFCAR